MSVIPLLTVQNTLGVAAVEPMAPSLILAQLDSVLEDLPLRAAKTGASPGSFGMDSAPGEAGISRPHLRDPGHHRSVRHPASRLRTPAGRRRGVLQQDAGQQARAGVAPLHHGTGAAVHDALPSGGLRRS